MLLVNFDNATSPYVHPARPAAEVYAALWIGALLAVTGQILDPLPPQIDDLAQRYFETYPPEVKA